MAAFEPPPRVQQVKAPADPPAAPRIAVGVAAALALGLVLGLVFRPQLAMDQPPPPPMRAVTPQMSIVVDPPKPPPAVPAAPGKLEVLPPDMAAAAPRLEARRAEPDCGGARSEAEAMVCADPWLAAADRRMRAAYRRAAEAGVPGLREEQEDWLWIREQAARRSPRAVAQVYAQRIDELEALSRGDGWD